MEPLLILPLLGFFILLILFSMVLRRAGRFLAQTRDVERFRRQVGDLGHRVEMSLGEVSRRVDAVRRGSIAADEIGADISASLEAVALYAGEAKALRPPIAGKSIQSELVSELERAARALEMVEHGRSIQTSARSAGRELEAQTSIKRGYLNVLHAREAIARQAQAATELNIGDGTERFQRRGT
jgi:hypothetical protein